MLVLIAISLTILAWSYLKECSNGFPERQEILEHHNVDNVAVGRNGMADDVYGMRVIVIMAGDENPTFIAKPISMACP